MGEIEKIKECFCTFIEESLIAHNIDKVMGGFCRGYYGNRHG